MRRVSLHGGHDGPMVVPPVWLGRSSSSAADRRRTIRASLLPWRAISSARAEMMTFDRDAYDVLQVQPKAHQLVLQAAYRVLAALYHPDRDSSAASNRKMAELNDAYAKVRTPDRREVYDKGRERQPAGTPAVVTPYAPQRTQPPTAGTTGSGKLDFGRYSGWTISQIAPHDPDYLRWLARHSSGIRFRGEIDRVLREPAPPPQLRRRR